MSLILLHGVMKMYITDFDMGFYLGFQAVAADIKAKFSKDDAPGKDGTSKSELVQLLSPKFDKTYSTARSDIQHEFTAKSHVSNVV